MLPDLPRNVPSMEILIQELEAGFCSMSASSRGIAAKPLTLGDGNFVKKIVEAYESSIRASNENSQWERTKERSNFSNILDIVKNRKNVEKNSSSTDAISSQGRNDVKKSSEIFLTSFEAYEIKNDFVVLNQYHSESDVKTVSETWPDVSPKINMYSSMNELSMNIPANPSKKKEIWNPKKRDKKFEDKTKKNKLLICSSLLEDTKEKDLDCEDPLDNILTSSCDSSSNNSYRNLQTNLYGFEDEQWQFELSSLSSLKSFSASSHNMLSINNDNGNLQDSLFQNATDTSSKDITKDRDNLRDSKLVPSPSSNSDGKSPRIIDTSLNKNRPINNDTCVIWISALGEKLSRKKPLKELLKSTFNTKLLNYTRVWKKSAEKQPNERTSDSGFIERFLSPSSSFSQKSCSDLNEKPPTSEPTFGTFGHAKNECTNDKSWSKSSRIVLTEVPRKEFTSDSEPSNSTSWVPSHSTIISCKENRENVESLFKSRTLMSSSKLKACCGYPPLLKHPYLPRNRIPKHSFVAKTKLDQTTEKESIEEKEMRCDAKERESDMCELESSSTSSVSQAELNTLYSNMSKWPSQNDNCDLSR